MHADPVTVRSPFRGKGVVYVLRGRVVYRQDRPSGQVFPAFLRGPAGRGVCEHFVGELGRDIVSQQIEVFVFIPEPLANHDFENGPLRVASCQAGQFLEQGADLVDRGVVVALDGEVAEMRQPAFLAVRQGLKVPPRIVREPAIELVALGLHGLPAGRLVQDVPDLVARSGLEAVVPFAEVQALAAQMQLHGRPLFR